MQQINRQKQERLEGRYGPQAHASPFAPPITRYPGHTPRRRQGMGGMAMPLMGGLAGGLLLGDMTDGGFDGDGSDFNGGNDFGDDFGDF